MYDIETPQELIARKTKDRDRIEAQYGNGVRPGYVSADLAEIDEQIANARRQIPTNQKA